MECLKPHTNIAPFQLLRCLLQATTLPRVAYCTMALVVSAAEMLDAIDARKVRRCCSPHILSGCLACRLEAR